MPNCSIMFLSCSNKKKLLIKKNSNLKVINMIIQLYFRDDY